MNVPELSNEVINVDHPTLEDRSDILEVKKGKETSHFQSGQQVNGSKARNQDARLIASVRNKRSFILLHNLSKPFLIARNRCI